MPSTAIMSSFMEFRPKVKKRIAVSAGFRQAGQEGTKKPGLKMETSSICCELRTFDLNPFPPRQPDRISQYSGGNVVSSSPPLSF
jgi:hypothetical protein